MYPKNQAKTLAGEATLQTNNEAPFSEEVENNASNSTLSVKKGIELFEKGRKQKPAIKDKHMKQTDYNDYLKQCNTGCKRDSSNVISNGSDRSIRPKMNEAGTDRSDALLVLDDDQNIEAAFNALCEENGVGYNRSYSSDQFDAESSTSSNSKTYNTTEVEKEEEDRKSGDKPKPLPRKVLQQDNSKNVAPPSPRTAANHVSNIIQPIAQSKEVKSDNEENIKELASDETIYSETNENTKSPKKNLAGSNSGISDQSPEGKWSDSEETVFSETANSQKCGNLMNGSNQCNNSMLSTNSPEKSDETSSEEVNSETRLIVKEEKRNKLLRRVKYALQQKEFIIFSVTAIVLSTSAALVYLQDKAKFIGFFANSPLYITIPILAIASLFVVSPIFCGIKQFKGTEECKIQGKNAEETLNRVLEYQPKDKVIKSVILEYSNGTHSNFTLNAWKSEKNFINIDEKVISRTNKVEAVIKDRPIFTALLIAVVATNIALPLGLLAICGIHNVKTFYQNPLSNNIGLSLLMGSGMVALLIVCLGVHYYRKTNCTNLVYSEERIDPEKVNEKFIKEIKEERTKVLEENHSKDGKRSSLTLEQVVVESHNYKDAVYSIS